jgi:hypothetical protein
MSDMVEIIPVWECPECGDLVEAYEYSFTDGMCWACVEAQDDYLADEEE